jgi:hypothetical protein
MHIIGEDPCNYPFKLKITVREEEERRAVTYGSAVLRSCAPIRRFESSELREGAAFLFVKVKCGL